MTKDRSIFADYQGPYDLTPADQRPTHARLAEAVSDPGTEIDGSVPGSADRDMQAHGTLWGAVAGVSLMAVPICCYLYARFDEPLYAIASVAFVAFSAFSVEFALRKPVTGRSR